MTNGTPNNPVGRSIAFLNVVLLMTALAIASPATKRNGSSSQAVPLQGPTVKANFTDKEVPADFALTLTLSRPLQSAEGRLAVLIGNIDFTNLFGQTTDGFTYFPRMFHRPEPPPPPPPPAPERG